MDTNMDLYDAESKMEIESIIYDEEHKANIDEIYNLELKTIIEQNISAMVLIQPDDVNNNTATDDDVYIMELIRIIEQNILLGVAELATMKYSDESVKYLCFLQIFENYGEVFCNTKVVRNAVEILYKYNAEKISIVGISIVGAPKMPYLEFLIMTTEYDTTVNHWIMSFRPDRIKNHVTFIKYDI